MACASIFNSSTPQPQLCILSQNRDRPNMLVLRVLGKLRPEAIAKKLRKDSPHDGPERQMWAIDSFEDRELYGA